MEKFGSGHCLCDKKRKSNRKKTGNAVITAIYKRKKYRCWVQVAAGPAGTDSAVGGDKENEGTMNGIITMDEFRDGSSVDTVGF